MPGAFSARATARLWSTAHITLAGLLAAALAWCAARLPGRTYDVDPLPVFLPGWCLWFFGLGYLASSAAVHVRLGGALRKTANIYRREWIVLVVCNALLTAVAAGCMFRGDSSHTHAFGLEAHAATVCTAAGLSTLLTVATGLRWRANLVPGKIVPARKLAVMSMNMMFAGWTLFTLISVELSPTSFGQGSATTTMRDSETRVDDSK